MTCATLLHFDEAHLLPIESAEVQEARQVSLLLGDDLPKFCSWLLFHLWLTLLSLAEVHFFCLAGKCNITPNLLPAWTLWKWTANLDHPAIFLTLLILLGKKK
jgi:hypothetical protein